MAHLWRPEAAEPRPAHTRTNLFIEGNIEAPPEAYIDPFYMPRGLDMMDDEEDEDDEDEDESEDEDDDESEDDDDDRPTD